MDNGYDFVNDDPDPADDLGHGTHVAGTIADCTQGLDVKILPVKVLSHQNEGYASNIACGIRYAVNNGAKVINYSICGPVQYDNTFIDDAIAHHDDDAYLAREAKEVETFLQAFPLYPQLG